MKRMARDVLDHIFLAVGMQRNTYHDEYVHDSPPDVIGSQNETKVPGSNAMQKAHFTKVSWTSCTAFEPGASVSS